MKSIRLTQAFQSTPPVKAATDFFAVAFQLEIISIHAAREGGDGSHKRSVAVRMISIHAAREGGDSRHPLGAVCSDTFQSTPPVKAATSPRAI